MTNNMLPLNCAHKIFFHHFKLNQFFRIVVDITEKTRDPRPLPFFCGSAHVFNNYKEIFLAVLFYLNLSSKQVHEPLKIYF
jgi:hypothetical protein